MKNLEISKLIRRLDHDQRLTVEVVYSAVDGLLGELGYRPVLFLIASNIHISELL
jgi:hypothetical protein